MCINVQASLFIHSLRLVGRRQGVSAIKCAAIDCLRPVVYDQISCSHPTANLSRMGLESYLRD